MKRLIVLITTILGFSFLVGCYSEDDIVPKEGGEMAFLLPQGHEPYDWEIVEWFEKYNFYTLYKFSERDLYWNNTTWTKFVTEAGGAGDLLGEPADPDYVGKQWDLCKQVFLNHYPDELLKMMPFKFLLCSELWRGVSRYDYMIKEMVYDTVRRPAYKSFDLIAMNYGGPEIDTISRATKMELQQALNTIFLTHLNTKEVFEIPEEFTSVSTYKYDAKMVGKKLLENGYLHHTSVLKDNVPQSKKNDFLAYLEMLTIPVEILDGVPPVSYDSFDPSVTGCLKYDMVKKKYNILIKYLKDKYDINTEGFQHPSFE